VHDASARAAAPSAAEPVRTPLLTSAEG